MKRVVGAGLAGFVLCLGLVADTLLPGGPRVPFGVAIVFFFSAFVGMAFVFRAITGQWLGHFPMSVFKPYIAVVPKALTAAMGVLLALVLANTFLMFANADDETTFARNYAGTLAWLNAAVAYLAYAVIRKRELDEAAEQAGA